MTPIDRGFHRTAAGLVHYRIAGCDTATPPLLMIHGGPGSSAALVPMIATMAQTRPIVAPDLMGNGDSDPPPAGLATIAFHADCMAQLLDALGFDRVDVYGHHSGAQVACELAIARPDRVRCLVLDGTALFTPAHRKEFAERYAPPIVPCEDGSHFGWAWDFAVNLTRYFPYYHREEKNRIIPATDLSPEATTLIGVDLLKAWPTYHLLYQAAFSHDLANRLPLVTQPTMVLEISGDPLARFATEAAALLPASRIALSSRQGRPRVIEDFLAGGQ